VRSPTTYRRLLAYLTLLLAVLAATPSYSQSISIYPTVLYPGVNKVTITARNGLSRVQRMIGSTWRNFLTGQTTSHLRVLSGPTFTTCATSATFMVLVTTMSGQVDLKFRVEDCDGDDRDFVLDLGEQWQVSRENFGVLEVGETVCRRFRVETRQSGTSYRVDSIHSPSRLFTIRYIEPPPPIVLSPSETYYYEVCFTATKPGTILMPINVYLHRRQPVPRYANFIVADTAYVTVIPARTPPPPPPVAHVRPPVHIPPKRVDTVVRIADVDTVGLREEAVPGATPPEYRVAELRPELPPAPSIEIVEDPTTFRNILGPNARSIGDGRGFIANYDLFGWLFGFGPTDRLSLIGGFAYVPEFIGYSLTVTAGGKYEFYRAGIVRGVGGVQFNYSSTDLSSIALVAPYLGVSVGDDDARASLTLGYSWRHHTPIDEPPFSRTAPIVGGGGDYRVGDHWKLVAEGYYIQASEFEPIALGVRYFGDRYAIDAGVAANVRAGDDGSSAVQIGPILSYIYTW